MADVTAYHGHLRHVTNDDHGFGNKFRGATLFRQINMPRKAEEKNMLGTILLIVLILLLLGALPNWGYSRSWGYGPSGGLGLVVLIIIILLLLGRI
jgi:hypothetical protein